MIFPKAFLRGTGSCNNVPLIQSNVYEQYSQYVQIYTDGSKIGTNAGCGVYIEDFSKRYAITFNKYLVAQNRMPFSTPFSVFFIYIFQKLRGVVGLERVGTAFPHFFHRVVCSEMKVNTS